MYIYVRWLGSIVGIATGYGLDGLGIESRWRRDFPHLSRPALEPTQPSLQWVAGLSRGVKSGRDVTLTPHPLLVPWSRKDRAIPLLPVWAVRPAQNPSACTAPQCLYRAPVPIQSPCACTRVTFTFTFVYMSPNMVKVIPRKCAIVVSFLLTYPSSRN